MEWRVRDAQLRAVGKAFEKKRIDATRIAGDTRRLRNRNPFKKPVVGSNCVGL